MRTGKDCFRATRRLRAGLLTSSALALAWALPATPSRAQDATWRTSPISVSYDDGSNWDTGSVPSGTAYFGTSNTPSLSIGSNTSVGGWTFNAGASNYLIQSASPGLTFTGAGIVINGGSLNFTTSVSSVTTFQNSSSAGTATIGNVGLMVFANNSTAAGASVSNGGILTFQDNSTAANAVITNNYIMGFVGSSTAGNAVITNNTLLNFDGTSTAGNATITNNSGGRTTFNDNSTAGNATIIINSGGLLSFYGNSTTGNATIIINNAGGNIYFSGTGPAGDGKLSVQSLTGAGTSYLDFIELTLGSNNQSSEVSGVITGTGSLVKAGSGTLTLSGGNSYVGGTTVTGGTLQLGTLANTGSIIGTVDVRAGTTLNLINSDGNGMAVTADAGSTVDFSNSAGPAGDHRQTVGSIAGAGSYLIGANELTVGSKGLPTEVSGVISGIGGSLVKIGAGTMTLTAANTYTGGTTVNGGTLQLGTLARAGSVVGAISVGAGGALSIVNTGVISSISNAGFTSYSNGMSAGSTAITNSGTLEFADRTTAGSAQITSTGTVNFRSTSSAGNATLTINGGTANFYDTSTAGSATITVNGSSQLQFNGNSSAGNATITNNATTIFTIGSSAGSATINNSGSLTFEYYSTAGNAAITNTSATALTQFSSIGPAHDGVISVGSIAGEGTFLVYGSWLKVGGNNASTVVSGTISVHGDLEKVGTGTLTLTGTATFSNASGSTSTTFVSGGTLQLGNASTAATFGGESISVGSGGTLDVVNTGPLNNLYQLTNAGSTIFRNSTGIDSNYSTTISNTGTLSFLDTSTAGTAYIDNNGTLAFSDHSSAGVATINNYAGHTLSFNGSSTTSSAAITNDGTLFFNNSSAAGSAIITNNHTAYFNDSSTAGSASITNNIGGTVVFDDMTTAGSAGITSSGTIYFYSHSTASSSTITNNGNIEFWANSTAETATIVNNGPHLWFTQNSSAGNATITNAGTGTFEFHDTSTAGSATINNNGQMQFIEGSTAGNASITNNHQLTFDDNATAGSSTITNNQQLRFTSSATAGTATITNNNQLTFDAYARAGNAIIINSGNVLFDGDSTPDNAQLTNVAPSAVINFYTPGLNSDGKISAGSIAGNGRFDLNGAELTVGGNNLSTVVTGVLTGDGSITGTSLVKVGTGTLTLAGINTYTGATTVDGGTLAVNGSIASSSSVTVNSGGALGGTGIVGNTTIASGGTLAPGNSIGTLTVSGNLTFSAGSSYTVEVSTTAADRTNVTGTATLTGATVQAVAIPGSFRGQTYTILTATGGLGRTQFAGLSVSGTFSPARNPHLTYDLDNVYLVLDPGKIVLPGGTSGNQTSVAGGINKAVEGGATPPAGFDVLLNMSDAQLARALNQVSGQPGAASTQAAFNAMQQFLGMLDPFGGGTDGERGGTSGDGGTLGYASTSPRDAKVREAYAAVTPRDVSGDVIDRRWGVWASGYGGASTLNGSTAAGSSTTTSRIYGTVVGADYRVSPNTLVGFALGGAGYNFSLSDSLGSGRADLFQAGLYARHNLGPAYLSAALAYGWQDVTTDRTVTVSGTDRLTANFKASTFAGRLETGWRFAPIPASTFGVTPYAAVQATTFHLPGYGETALVGSNQFALSYTSQDTTNVRTELGTRTDQRFLVNDGLLTLRGRLAWAHDTNTNRFVNAAFQTLPGAAFAVSGAQPAADSALVGGRAEMRWRNGLSLAGTVEGEFSRSTQTYTGKGTVRYEW
ncbi:autotransporter domain-containing protein [Bradyrhizobium sp. SSUT18]|uniref:beta strand repeat-containing protein n=1 Tax=Bradyrhizobium sp. SSUT18 TaxID=3040602 RepID=UPI00244A15F5|nr:autotransporter domain-containing protein [Bradyrhizobium sp. SSUT18]MDH2400368.1 autotransporter domain-containing protein [Bradyrhizobium sp. SSUT18]